LQITVAGFRRRAARVESRMSVSLTLSPCSESGPFASKHLFPLDEGRIRRLEREAN